MVNIKFKHGPSPAKLVLIEPDHETWAVSCFFCAHKDRVRLCKGVASQYFKDPFRCPRCNKAATYGLTRGKLKKPKKGSTTPALFDESELPNRAKKSRSRKMSRDNAQH